MCTMSDTKVTTAIISADRRSIRNPTSILTPSLSSQVYTGAVVRRHALEYELVQHVASTAPQEIATAAEW